jgi:hypothetical protein
MSSSVAVLPAPGPPVSTTRRGTCVFVQSQGIMVLSRCSRHSDYANVVLVEGAEIQRLSALWSRPLGNRSQAFGFFPIGGTVRRAGLQKTVTRCCSSAFVKSGT